MWGMVIAAVFGMATVGCVGATIYEGIVCKEIPWTFVGCSALLLACTLFWLLI